VQVGKQTLYNQKKITTITMMMMKKKKPSLSSNFFKNITLYINRYNIIEEEKKTQLSIKIQTI
jgi:hypothetical protein